MGVDSERDREGVGQPEKNLTDESHVAEHLWGWIVDKTPLVASQSLLEIPLAVALVPFELFVESCPPVSRLSSIADRNFLFGSTAIARILSSAGNALVN